ncbi:transcription initiation factor IIB family protein [Halobacterium litoreum]|uniref:Transcription initiation factor IIB family protein n=1 Tax=Halobacterium litoreum TaxID=2039234 RepID=A0ABD5N9L8_9EURY|nr:transcription initiation factor IIB family protein [Halobacterium litoreum]UHH12037.1 transcription initiation factor IIB family protein [Halobacterium litoreum]
MTSEEMSAHHRTVGRALDTIRSAATELGVPAATEETATTVFRRYRDQRDGPPNSVRTTGAACLYVACKVERVPRTVDEVVAAADVDRTHLLRRAKDVTSTLGVDLSGFADATQYVERYADDLELPTAVRERAVEIVNCCEEAGIAGGKSPSGWAAAAVYNACVEADLDVRQDTLTELADVTHVTIRNRYQDQREVLRERNPPPERAVAALDWYETYLSTSEYVHSSARDLLERVADAEDVDEAPAAWAAAALRVASDRAGRPIGMKALKTPSGCSSTEIHDRTSALSAD